MASANNTVDKFGRGSSSSSKVVIKRGLPGVGFRLTNDGNYDMQSKLVKNMAEPTDSRDGATRNYVDKQVFRSFHDTRKAVEESTDVIIDTLKKYVVATKTSLNEEYRTNLDKQSNNLSEQMRKYVEEKNTEIQAKFYEILNKRIQEVSDTLRAYVNNQMEELKGLNIITMKQNNIIAERTAVVEQDIKILFERV